MRISCLHTAESNVAVLDAAAVELGVTLHHAVEPRLLAEASATGIISDSLTERTRSRLRDLARNADVVMLTCSTLGPVLDGAPGLHRVVRIDAALAARAAASNQPVVVLCTAPTTLAPTTTLFEAAARYPGQMTIRLIPGAWDLFLTGHETAYLHRIAHEADAVSDTGATVAFAQASMTPAMTFCKSASPLTSPTAGLAAAIALGARF